MRAEDWRAGPGDTARNVCGTIVPIKRSERGDITCLALECQAVGRKVVPSSTPKAAKTRLKDDHDRDSVRDRNGL